MRWKFWEKPEPPKYEPSGNVFFADGKRSIMSGVVDLALDPIKVALVGRTYNPYKVPSQYFSQVQPHEVAGTGYTAGGQHLTNRMLETRGGDCNLRANNATWSNSTITGACGVIIYADLGPPEVSPVIGFVDLGRPHSSCAGNFTVEWDNRRVLKI